MANTDLTFITNEAQQNLKTRFQVLIKDTKLLVSFKRYGFMMLPIQSGYQSSP